ncbi:MAG: hypothetical protein HDT39_00425 [Lachnospiraceae bacterium]|nr:hypothetical protein [Lachnospiraceae bacterium]
MLAQIYIKDSKTNFSDEITVLEFESYKTEQEVIHRFTPFHDEQEINVDNEDRKEIRVY